MVRRSIAYSRRGIVTSALASLAAPAFVRGARGAVQFRFKLHHAASTVSCAHENFLTPWASNVELQSGGRIAIEIFPAMQLGGQPAELIDQVRQRMVDFAWTMPCWTPGRFPRVETFELPFVAAHEAAAGSRALEQFARENAAVEFRDVHPICFSCADRAVIHADRAIGGAPALKGLRLGVETRFAAEAVRVLGGHGMAVPSAQLPYAIARRAVDGCVAPWDMAPALKLGELLKNHLDFAASSFATAAFVLAMNKYAYERLPADLKAVIDDNSGMAAAGMAGAMWDAQARTAAAAVGRDGHSVVTVAADAVPQWRKATEPVIALWLRQMKLRHIDGAKMLDAARTLVARYEPPSQTAPVPQSKAEASPAPGRAAAEAPPPEAASPPPMLNIPL